MKKINSLASAWAGSKDTRLFQELIIEAMPYTKMLARKLVFEHVNVGRNKLTLKDIDVSLEDVEALAIEGFMKVMGDYTPDHNIPFHSFITPRIINHCYRMALRDYAGLVALPVSVTNKAKQLLREVDLDDYFPQGQFEGLRVQDAPDSDMIGMYRLALRRTYLSLSMRRLTHATSSLTVEERIVGTCEEMGLEEMKKQLLFKLIEVIRTIKDPKQRAVLLLGAELLTEEKLDEMERKALAGLTQKEIGTYYTTGMERLRSDKRKARLKKFL